jgi:hypothetical protein
MNRPSGPARANGPNRLRPRPARLLLVASLLACTAGAPAPATAQGSSGTGGTTGASVLELPAGSRAAGFAGAYTAASGDIDALFYNPAGIATLWSGAGLAYQAYVADVKLGSAAGAWRLGGVVLGAAVNYLDGGSIPVLEPDPAYGGERGIETGQTASAGETAIKVAVAGILPALGLRVGAAAGYVSSSIAGINRGAPFFDFGLQRDVGPVTLAGSILNYGGALSGSVGDDEPLPSEARFGAMATLPVTGRLGAVISADVGSRLQGGGTLFLAGGEFGLHASASSPLTAVARIGFSNEAGGGGLGGALRLGAGFGVGPLSFDYAYQNLNFFGPVHRLGLRWTRLHR